MSNLAEAISELRHNYPVTIGHGASVVDLLLIAEAAEKDAEAARQELDRVILLGLPGIGAIPLAEFIKRERDSIESEVRHTRDDAYAWGRAKGLLTLLAIHVENLDPVSDLLDRATGETRR